jgi:hypothetical protein
MKKIYLIYGEDLKAGEERLDLYSIWEHREDAKAELIRLEAKFDMIQFQIEKFELNQSSDEKIF